MLALRSVPAEGSRIGSQGQGCNLLIPATGEVKAEGSQNPESMCTRVLEVWLEVEPHLESPSEDLGAWSWWSPCLESGSDWLLQAVFLYGLQNSIRNFPVDQCEPGGHTGLSGQDLGTGIPLLAAKDLDRLNCVLRQKWGSTLHLGVLPEGHHIENR